MVDPVAPGEVEGGLECRACGCRHLPVYKTRRRGKTIVRYRQCRHCQKTMTTTERPAG